MRVLLTGGTGFIGLHTARALVEAGHAVRALRRPESRPVEVAAPLGGGNLEWVEGDLLDPLTLAEVVSGCEAVIHVAGDVLRLGSPAARAHQRLVNVDGTRNLLEAALAAGRVRRWVHTSSVVALGQPPPGAIADENTEYPPLSPSDYATSKREGEEMARQAGARGLEVLVLYPSLVMGPDDPRRRFATLMGAIRLGLVRVVPPGGLTLADVRSVAEAHVAALTRGRPGQGYILGGAHVTWRALFDELAAALGAPRPLLTLPPEIMQWASVPLGVLESLGVPTAAVSSRLARFGAERFYSSAKAALELGYRERLAGAILRDTAAWYRSSGS